MTIDTISEGEDFDFNGMFHTCTDGFSWDIEARRLQEDQIFTALCSKFQNAVKNGPNILNLIKYCKVLGIYLKHIGGKIKENDRKNCCKLFYYKLKKDIIRNFDLNCTSAHDCYQKMIERRVENISTTISGICIQYSEHIENDSSKLLEYLFNIYYDFDLLNGFKKGDMKTMRKFKQEIVDLENYRCNNKRRLKTELENIIQKCEDYKKKWKEKPYSHTANLLDDDWMNERRMKIKELDNDVLMRQGIRYIKNREIKQTNVLVAHALMDTVREGETHTGISVGMIFITSSLLIIMFILYKYTPYFSFLKPRIQKLRRSLNKNNKTNRELMYSFDVEYKNSVDGRYKIAYS
ncbi:variable surface protein [Plasmodium gonderi]|uniref:Variable surface protein n=1 Tax=Plasmodium gonderi TaxID=77519 RepID=A0A1Y1JSL3_PLAGO|nr:variable surface protein [Plasmodium gonderi]GAW84147.1 variable surface protein [Plasmodium gonderi]